MGRLAILSSGAGQPDRCPHLAGGLTDPQFGPAAAGLFRQCRSLPGAGLRRPGRRGPSGDLSTVRTETGPARRVRRAGRLFHGRPRNRHGQRTHGTGLALCQPDRRSGWQSSLWPGCRRPAVARRAARETRQILRRNSREKDPACRYLAFDNGEHTGGMGRAIGPGGPCGQEVDQPLGGPFQAHLQHQFRVGAGDAARAAAAALAAGAAHAAQGDHLGRADDHAVGAQGDGLEHVVRRCGCRRWRSA